MEIGGYTRLRRRLMLAMLAFSLVPLLALGLFFQTLIIECLISTALLHWQGSGWSFSLLPCPAQPAQPPFLQLHKQGGPLPLLTAPEGSV